MIFWVWPGTWTQTVVREQRLSGAPGNRWDRWWHRSCWTLREVGVEE